MSHKIYTDTIVSEALESTLRWLITLSSIKGRVRANACQGLIHNTLTCVSNCIHEW